MSKDALLKVRDLSVTYRLGSAFGASSKRVFEAVKRVSFDIEAGQGVALVGESGSGKTTISRAILGLVPISGGSIEFELAGGGRFTKAHKKADLTSFTRDVQVVFQNPRSSLNPRRSISAAISSVLNRHFALTNSQTRDRVAELLGCRPTTCSVFPVSYRADSFSAWLSPRRSPPNRGFWCATSR